MNPSVAQELDFHAKALLLRSQRQRLIASNIANADTPGYVAREIDFAASLAQQLGAGANSAKVTPAPVRLTAAAHLPGKTTSPADAQLVYAWSSQPSADRNTVDLDRERASFTDNAIHYESTLRFMNFHIRSLLSAIQGQ